MGISAGGCGCPKSERIRLMTLASFAFTNNAPNSASAAEAATIFKISHVIATVELDWYAIVRNVT